MGELAFPFNDIGVYIYSLNTNCLIIICEMIRKIRICGLKDMLLSVLFFRRDHYFRVFITV